MKKIIFIVLAAMMAMPLAASASTADVHSSLTDKKPSRKKGEIKEVTFIVAIDCENCVKKVQENVAFEKGVKDLKISLEDQTVFLKYDAAKTSEAVLKKAIEDLGYPVNDILAPGQKVEHHHNHDHNHDHGHHHHS